MKKDVKLIATLFSVVMIGFAISSFTKSTIGSSSSVCSGTGRPQFCSFECANPPNPNFNLEVILRGEGKSFGHVKFRQDNDADKVIDLGVWVRDLEPNHRLPPAEGSGWLLLMAAVPVRLGLPLVWD